MQENKLPNGVTVAVVQKLDFLSANPALPYSVTANANVTDVNRQSWGASTSLLVHPSSLYVGLKTKRTFLEKGQPIELDVIGVDIDGKFAPGRTFDVKAVRLDWTYKKDNYEEVEKDAQACKKTSTEAAVRCSFVPKEGGGFRGTAGVAGPPDAAVLRGSRTGSLATEARLERSETARCFLDSARLTEYHPS